MADLTITAANVQKQGGASTGEKTAAATITAGQVLSANSSAAAVLASNTSATLAAAIGIALHGAASGQPVQYLKDGDINLGATLAVGKHYVLSASGAISPVDDIESGDYATYIGLAISTSVLRVRILPAPAAAAGAVT